MTRSVVPRTVDPADVQREPWRNGAGSTRVLAEHLRAPAALGWRVSLADLDRPADFSTYPGVDRCSTVVTGAGLRLVVDGVPTSAGPRQVVAYDGGVEVRAEPVDGPVSNLNLMVARSWGSAAMRVRCADGPTTWCPPTVAVLLVEGVAALVDGRRLAELEAVLLDGEAVTLAVSDAVLVEVCAVPGEA